MAPLPFAEFVEHGDGDGDDDDDGGRRYSLQELSRGGRYDKHHDLHHDMHGALCAYAGMLGYGDRLAAMERLARGTAMAQGESQRRAAAVSASRSMQQTWDSWHPTA